MVCPVIAVLQGHGDEPLAVFLRTTHQRPARRLRISRFQTQTAIYIMQQLVVVRHGPSSDGDRPGGGDPHQGLVFQRGPGQLRHVPCSGIVLLVIQTVGVGEGGMFHPQLPGLFVHQGYKALDAAAHMLGHRHRRIVSGAQQHPV